MSLGIVLRRSGIFPAGLSHLSKLPASLEDNGKGEAVEEGVASHGAVQASGPVIYVSKGTAEKPEGHERSKVMVHEGEDEARGQSPEEGPPFRAQGTKENSSK